MTPNYRAVFFDLDGTLLDTALDLVPAVTETVHAAGYSPAGFDSVRAVISAGSRGMLAAAAGLAAESAEIDAMIPDFHQRYALETGERSVYFAGIEPVINALEKASIPWGIVTNKKLQFAQSIAERQGFSQRAAVIVGGDTLPQIKPHPAPLLYACAAVNQQPEHCLFIGDSAFDIEAAKNAGMASCAVRWGYTPPDEQAEDWQADFTISHADELHDILWQKTS